MKVVVFGGGGGVTKEFTRLASPLNEVIVVTQDERYQSDIRALGGSPRVLDTEYAAQPEVTAFLEFNKPDAVIWAVSPGGGSGGAGNELLPPAATATKTFEAIEQAGLRRVLLISTIDARNTSKPHPRHYNEVSRWTSDGIWKLIPGYMAAKMETEQALHRSGLDFTLLRPGVLVDTPARGVELGLVQIAKNGYRNGALDVTALIGNMKTCSRALVGEVLLACLQDAGTIGLTLGVMDGDKDVFDEVQRCARDGVDAWEE